LPVFSLCPTQASVITHMSITPARTLYSLGIAVLLTALLASCYRPPEFANEPSITFNSVEFKDLPPTSSDGLPQADTLVITLNFRDGDGNLGLGRDDNDPPYQPLFFFFNPETGGPIQAGDSDTLPPVEWPFICTNWVQNPTIGDQVLEGTFYVRPNPGFNNIFVEYLVKQPDGSYEEFDWVLIRENECGISMDGRFPLLSDQDNERPIEGTLRYAMPSTGFSTLFFGDSLKLRVRIQDRDLNMSNTIETPDFTLLGITAN